MNAIQSGITVALFSIDSEHQKWLKKKMLQAGIVNLDSSIGSYAADIRKSIQSLPDCIIIACNDPIPHTPGISLPTVRLGGCEPAGADIHLRLPCKSDEIIQALKKATTLESCIETNLASQRICFASRIMKSFYREALLYADSEVNALILGDTGTGKEVVARLLHKYHSKRYKGPFISVNCGAIPEGLFEAEFFGYVSGAFTGATRNHAGYFEQANEGTIFLDEIGELPLYQQVKLLRVIEQQAITPLGSRHCVHLNFRLIAATNRNLNSMVHSGSFRSDLYYRLAVAVLNLPDLEARGRHEKRLIFSQLIETISKKEKLPINPIPEWLFCKIEDKYFKGNIREMMNIAERIVLTYRVNDGWVKEKIYSTLYSEPEKKFQTSLQYQPERERIINALKKNRWIRKETARELGISRKVLWEKMHKYRLYDHPDHIGKGPKRRAE